MKRTAHASAISPAHAYTRSKTPWIIGDAPKSQKTGVCNRLVYFLSGGGMRTFGRTLSQESARIRHRRAFAWCGVLAFVWLVFYLV